MKSLEKLLRSENKGDPWHHAAVAERDYLTPEDVENAIAAGGDVLVVAKACLQAVEMGCVEDASCTAFVALKAFKKKKTK